MYTRFGCQAPWTRTNVAMVVLPLSAGSGNLPFWHRLVPRLKRQPPCHIEGTIRERILSAMPRTQSLLGAFRHFRHASNSELPATRTWFASSLTADLEETSSSAEDGPA